MTIKIVDDFPSIAQRLKELEDKKRQIQNLGAPIEDIEYTEITDTPASAKRYMSGDACSYCMRGTLTHRGTFYTCDQCGRNYP